MGGYLFVHFREKTTPDGEQVYFALSRDGLRWEALNGGAPVLWSYFGTRGVRDCTITRHPSTGRYYILGTDLSLSYCIRQYRAQLWETVGSRGSRDLCLWESDDLVNWSEPRMVTVGREDFGCVWAPDVLYDREKGDYILHWSSSVAADGYKNKRIFYSRTQDFVTFSQPRVLYEDPGKDIIDSALYEENGRYYLFVKCERDPGRVRLLSAPSPTGPFTRCPAFDESMLSLEEGKYEGATAVRLADRRWALFLDYYGARGAQQGYVPFLGSLETGEFTRCDGGFSFPYRFKHGTILPLTGEEYLRMKNHDWTDKGFPIG